LDASSEIAWAIGSLADAREPMTNLLGQLVPLALGVAASPISIVAVLVILLTKRARLGSLAFSLSWVAGIALALFLSVAFADRVPTFPQGLDLPFEGLITVLLGVGLVVAALVARRGRFRSDDPYRAPGWVSAVDDLSPVGGAIVAFTNATTSPKNLALALAAGVAIRDANLRSSEMMTAEAVYIAIACLTVVVPVVVYFLGGVRTEATIAHWKDVVTARAAGIMELTLFILGLVLAAKGLYNLLSALA